jgi:large subunit ribosomal protein L29
MPRSTEKLRQMDKRELEVHERELAEQVFRLRFQHATGQAESLKKLRVVRKDLARVKTLLGERERKVADGK